MMPHVLDGERVFGCLPGGMHGPSKALDSKALPNLLPGHFTMVECTRCGVNPCVSRGDLHQAGAAAEQIGIDRNNHYHWLREDPVYAETFRYVFGV